MLNRPSYKVITAFVVIPFLLSCLSRDNSDSRTQQIIETDSVVELSSADQKEQVKKVQKIFYSLPSPLELSILFKNEGIQYIPAVMHNLDVRERYLVSKKKALNLGVYGADLSNAGLFSKHEDAIAYLKVCQVMADELGVGQTFEQELISRLEKNPNSRDTLLNVISDFFLNNESFLRSSKQQNITTYIIAGGWIEALYLGSHMVDANTNADGVRNIVAGQRYSLENLLDLLSSIEDNGSFNNMNQRLIELYDLYKTIEYPEFLQTPDSFKENDFAYYDTSKGGIKISEESFQAIKSKVKEIRESIIFY